MIPFTRKQKLELARSKIARGWIQSEVAQDANGYQIEADDPMAVKFCLAGAFIASGMWNGGENEWRTFANWHQMKYEQDPVAFNDEPWTTQEEVLGRLDEYIATVEE